MKLIDKEANDFFKEYENWRNMTRMYDPPQTLEESPHVNGLYIRTSSRETDRILTSLLSERIRQQIDEEILRDLRDNNWGRL